MANYFRKDILHLIHCTALMGFVVLIMVFGESSAPKKSDSTTEQTISSWEKYGLIPTLFLYFTRLLTLLGLPLAFANFLGLLIFNAFPDQPKTKVLDKFN